MTTLFWQDPDSGETEILAFDAVVSLSPEDSVTITDHPVEQGSNITDHARDEPERLSIEGIVSTVPNVAVDDDAELSSLDLEVARIVRLFMWRNGVDVGSRSGSVIDRGP